MFVLLRRWSWASAQDSDHYQRPEKRRPRKQQQPEAGGTVGRGRVEPGRAPSGEPDGKYRPEAEVSPDPIGNQLS